MATETELQDLGLSNYEVRVYCSLLEKGLNTARLISKISGVPFGRIYDVLSTLEAKGIIERQDSRPKRYLPIDPSNAVKRLVELKKKEFDFLTEKAMMIEENLNKIYVKNTSESAFWSVTVGDEAINTFMDKTTEASTELLLYMEFNHLRYYAQKNSLDSSLEILVKLLRRNVEVKILLGLDNLGLLSELLTMVAPFLQYLEKIEIRTTDIKVQPFDVIDGEKVILKVNNPAKPKEHFAGIYVWQKRFAEEIREKFFQMWSKAQTLQLNFN